MTSIEAGGVMKRAASAETLIAPSIELRLLLDSTATCGALSAHRVRLGNGADGANPHRHVRSSEMFYVLDGMVDLLVGDDVITATTGDLVVVPPGSPHAFAASAGQNGELLVVITPGIDRFDFFRSVHSVLTGATSPSSLKGVGERFDNYPAAAPGWDALRRGSAHERTRT
ncbi:MAG: cupin domain-containing protein [Jatrophihabitans sp.]|uniref:cupin domain-containing protein n=1 Tax=Jatrophihabitans sp. TaxID=1932789 RepID=UPI00390EE122